nr:immunoglobulin heavy chain junction region [Macaca mulatta]
CARAPSWGGALDVW